MKYYLYIILHEAPRLVVQRGSFLFFEVENKNCPLFAANLEVLTPDVEEENGFEGGVLSSLQLRTR